MNFLVLNRGIPLVNCIVALQRTGLMFIRIPNCLSISLITFVGREMGKRCISEAKRYSIASMLLYTLIVIVLSTTVYIFKENWVGLFTSKLYYYLLIYL